MFREVLEDNIVVIDLLLYKNSIYYEVYWWFYIYVVIRMGKSFLYAIDKGCCDVD